MKFQKTINHFEWILYIIFSYYLVFASGVIMLYMSEAGTLRGAVKILFFLITALTSLVIAKLIVKVIGRSLSKSSAIKIILIYLAAISVLFLAIPMYINTLLTLFDVI